MPGGRSCGTCLAIALVGGDSSNGFKNLKFRLGGRRMQEDDILFYSIRRAPQGLPPLAGLGVEQDLPIAPQVTVRCVLGVEFHPVAPTCMHLDGESEIGMVRPCW